MKLTAILILAFSLALPVSAADYLVFIRNEDGSYRNSNGLWQGTPPKPGFDVPDTAVVIEYPGKGIPEAFEYVAGELNYTSQEMSMPAPQAKPQPPAPLKLEAKGFPDELK